MCERPGTTMQDKVNHSVSGSPLEMVNNRRKLKAARKRIREARRLSVLKRALRAKKKRKQLKARETPTTLQIASIKDNTEGRISEEKMMEYADKLQKKYFKAKETMCSNCKRQPVTKVITSFKKEGQEKKTEMRALIIDFERLSEAGIPGIGEFLNLNEVE